jgi:hypothetical protein
MGFWHELMKICKDFFVEGLVGVRVRKRTTSGSTPLVSALYTTWMYLGEHLEGM